MPSDVHIVPAIGWSADAVPVAGGDAPGTGLSAPGQIPAGAGMPWLGEKPKCSAPGSRQFETCPAERARNTNLCIGHLRQAAGVMFDLMLPGPPRKKKHR